MIAGCFFTAWMGQLAHLLRDECDWRIVALVRGALAFVFAVALARLSGAKLVVWRPKALWLRGFASSASLLCTFYALSRLPTSEVLTLTNTFPIWVALLSWPLFRMPPSLSVWVAAVCGVVGVALIESPHFETDSRATLALGLALTAALTNAVAMLGLNRIKGVHPWAIVAHYSGVATVVILVSWTIGPRPDLAAAYTPRALFLLLGVGVAATLGQVCITRAFQAGNPGRVAVVGLSQVLFALGLDLLFDPHGIAGSMLVGIAFVLVPLAWMMSGRTTKTPPPPPAEEPRARGPEPEPEAVGVR
jgi:drug/metabolite transporter (DMT)-like permease